MSTRITPVDEVFEIHTSDNEARYAVIVYGNVQMPDYCTCCLKPTASKTTVDKIYRSRGVVQEAKKLSVKVPICDECLKHHQFGQKKYIYTVCTISVIASLVVFCVLLGLLNLNWLLSLIISEALCVGLYYILNIILKIKYRNHTALGTCVDIYTSLDFDYIQYSFDPLRTENASGILDAVRLMLNRKYRDFGNGVHTAVLELAQRHTINNDYLIFVFTNKEYAELFNFQFHYNLYHDVAKQTKDEKESFLKKWQGFLDSYHIDNTKSKALFRVNDEHIFFAIVIAIISIVLNVIAKTILTWQY